MRFIFPILVFSLALPVGAQSVSNVVASLSDEKISVKYDLTGGSADRFAIECFYSTDDGRTYPYELTAATGDIGLGQQGGKGKTIIWDVKKNLVDFDGNLKFKVHATLPENFFKGNSISVQIVKLERNNDRYLNMQGYFFGNAKTKINILLNSIIRDTNGRSYKLVGGKIDNQLASNSFEVTEGDTHFFNMLFAPLNGEQILSTAPTVDLALLVFNDQKIEMKDLKIKSSK